MIGQRNTGLLLHITSLPSKFGIGDLGPKAYQFVNLLAKNHLEYWQILPFNPTESKHDNSPYHSSSAYAGNPLLISLQLLLKDGLLTREDLNHYQLPEGESVPFSTLYPLREDMLRKVCHSFRKKTGLHSLFENFCRQNTSWLKDYAFFEVIRRQYPDLLWNQWPVGLKNRDSECLKKFNSKFKREIEDQKIIQFLFFRQLNSLKNYCRLKGIKMIGDLPIYVTYHSTDVWSNPDLFKLDEEFKPLFQAGVPPDYFSKTGQLWGNPVYQWENHQKNGYQWWLKRISHNLSTVDLLRIDHFRGLVAYWEIPANEKTAINGRWVPGGGKDFFRTLTQKFPDKPFVAEDLGVITEDVIEMMNEFSFPGMRVILFGFDHSFPHSIHLPHHYPSHVIAYTGTHDNNTIHGWLEKELTQGQLKKLKQYLGKNRINKKIHWELIELVTQSPADLVIFPVQDLLGLDGNARMNNPACSQGNWKWCLSNMQFKRLQGYALPKLKQITKKDHRGYLFSSK